ncbi:MAG: DUF1592 domain-containing protein [Opitutales bacterium]
MRTFRSLPYAGALVASAVIAPCLVQAAILPEARPYFEQHCFECHSSTEQKGSFDFEGLLGMESVHDAPKDWQDVADVIFYQEMPPAEKPQFTEAEREILVRWIEEELEREDTRAFDLGPSIPRRLNRDEFANTLYDLTGVELDIASLIPGENIINFGFDTIADDLDFTASHLENYLLVADLAVEKMFSSDPEVVTPQIIEARARYFSVQPSAVNPPEVAIKKNIHRFASHAFRRYLSDGELQIYTTLARLELENGASYLQALQSCVKAVLLSPQFLYRVEDIQIGSPAEPITQLELASRLSFFLWSSMPDDELLKLAAEGTLNEPETLRGQLQRMLTDEKAARLSERFVNQWLFFELEEHIPDPNQFPMYDDAVHESAQTELNVFFRELFKNGHSVRDLIDANYVYVNEPLADFYGIEGVAGETFQKVTVDDFRRGGMLGMSAILVRTSMATRTSPTKRGKWVLDALFGNPPPPPPDVEPIDEATQTNAQGRILTFREKLELHSQEGSACISCHVKMDPYGFAMENFDAVGRWRDMDGPYPVEARAELPSGREINGLEQLKAHLKEREQDIIRNFAEKLMIYALGRGLTADEYLEVRTIVSGIEDRNFPANELLLQLVSSYTFQHKRGPSQAGLAQIANP